MNCYKLNESTQNKIVNVLEETKPKEYDSESTYFKSLYSPGLLVAATLVNDWYEKRTEQKQEIVFEPVISENMDCYREICKTSVPDRREYFNQIFEGYGLGHKLLIDHQGLAYTDNYVTTTDLTYNYLTKGICGPYARRYFKGKYKPESDLTKIYGNLTHWGLKESVYEKIEKASRPEQLLPVTETTAEYVAYDPKEIKKLNDFPSFKKLKTLL